MIRKIAATLLAVSALAGAAAAPAGAVVRNGSVPQAHKF